MQGIKRAALAGVLLTPAAPAAAGEVGSADVSLIATYHGRMIRLADGWQGAQICVVLTDDDIRCYDTDAEMRDDLGLAATEGTANATDLLNAAASCGGSLVFVDLYDDIGFGGLRLRLAQTANWDDLAPAGFDNRMESWVNDKDCVAILADGTNGNGDFLQLNPNSSNSNVGLSWKNRASSAWVFP